MRNWTGKKHSMRDLEENGQVVRAFYVWGLKGLWLSMDDVVGNCAVRAQPIIDSGCRRR